MPDLSSIVTDIQDILQDGAYTEQRIVSLVNDALQNITAGIRMPNGEVSPPLPDLYAYGTVNTSITLPYVSLPADYQRRVSLVYDSTSNKITPPRGGDYYSFGLFLRQLNKLDLSETGSIYQVGIRGSRIYYQGIPSASTTIGLHYYRKPATLALDGDVPEGIPEHLHGRILQAYVLMNVMGEKIEAGVAEPAIGTKYWTGQFYEAMTDMIDFIGVDASPQYYGEGGFEDGGNVDG